MNKIVGSITEFLNKFDLLSGQKLFMVGFSGGYDSICLLDVLNNMSKEYRFRLVAVHLNHNWRGEESVKEEKSAKKYCEKNGIEFYSEALNPELPQTELEARNQRYEFYKRAYKRILPDAVFTGHTHSDQVETVLYRIIKGTGIKGLAGIPELRTEGDMLIYRPLLDITREETIRYCENNNLEVNIDSSNADTKYLRNSIRHELLPILKKYNSGVEDSLSRLADIANDYENIVSDCVLLIKKDFLKDNVFDAKKFALQSAPVQKKLIVDYLAENDFVFDSKKVEEIFGFISKCSTLKSGNTLSLGVKKWLFASSSEIKIIDSIKANTVQTSLRVNLLGETKFDDLGKTLVARPWRGGSVNKFPFEFAKRAIVDLNRVPKPLFLRTRREGDVFQPFGMQEKMRLKKYLINKGIPEHNRDSLLLLATNDEVVWVVGVGVSEKLRVKNEPTHELEVI